MCMNVCACACMCVCVFVFVCAVLCVDTCALFAHVLVCVGVFVCAFGFCSV